MHLLASYDSSYIWLRLSQVKVSESELYLRDCYMAPSSSTVHAGNCPYDTCMHRKMALRTHKLLENASTPEQLNMMTTLDLVTFRIFCSTAYLSLYIFSS